MFTVKLISKYNTKTFKKYFPAYTRTYNNVKQWIIDKFYNIKDIRIDMRNMQIIIECK